MNEAISGHFKRLQAERDMYREAVFTERKLRLVEREKYKRRLNSKIMCLFYAVVDGLESR
jgi:hypothetical protein